MEVNKEQGQWIEKKFTNMLQIWQILLQLYVNYLKAEWSSKPPPPQKKQLFRLPDCILKNQDPTIYFLQENLFKLHIKSKEMKEDISCSEYSKEGWGSVNNSGVC